MENNIIKIATLSIDSEGVQKSIVDTKKEIFELQKANTELRKDISKNGDATGEQTKKFVENEAKLKSLNESYKAQSSALNELTLAQLKENTALTQNAKSINQATDQNKELLKIRNSVDASTSDGIKAIDLLNAKMDENNKFILKNKNEQEKASTVTGNYRQYMFGLGDSFDKARTVVQGFTSVTSKMGEVATKTKNTIIGFGNSSKKQAEELQKVTQITGGASKSNDVLSGTLKGVTGGSDGLGKSLSMIGKIGIIAVITLIVAVFTRLYQTFAPIKDIVDGLISSFKSLGESIMSVVKFLSMGDFSKAGDAIGEMGKNANNAYTATVNLNKAIRELEASTSKLAVTTAMYAGKEKEFQIAFEDSTKSMDSRTLAMVEVLNMQKAQLKSNADLARQELGIEQKKLGILLNGRKLTKELLSNDLEVAEQFNALQKKKATLYTSEQEIKLFNLQKTKKISDSNVKIADDEFKIITGNIKKQVELLDTKLQKEGITSKEISKIVAKEQELKMQALGEYDRVFKKVSGNKIGASDIFDEQGFVRIGINMFDMAKKFQLSANQADRLRDMLGEYKDIDDRLVRGKKLETDTIKKEQNERITLAKKTLENTKLVFESEKHTVEEQLKYYIKYYDDLNKLQGNENKIQNAQDLSSKILEITKDTINKEIEEQNKVIENKKNISLQEKNDLLKNAEFLKEVETKKVQESLLNEKDKNIALGEIQKGFLENKALIEKSYIDAEKLRKEEQLALEVLEHEMKLIDLENQGLSENELKKRILEEEHAERLRLISLELDAEGNLTKEAQKKKDIEDKKYQKASKIIDDQVKATKIKSAFEIADKTIGILKNLFGESKSLAIAQALLNTYEGITAELSTKPKTPYGIGLKVANVAFIASSGFAAVKNIMKTDKGSTDSGSGGGSSVAGNVVYDNPARTESTATVQNAPVIEQQNQFQPVLVLETLDEVKNNQQIKINSN